MVFDIKRLKLQAGIVVFFLVAITLSYYPTYIPFIRKDTSNFDRENPDPAVDLADQYYYAGYKMGAKYGVKATIKTLDFQGPLPPVFNYKHAAEYVNVYFSDYNDDPDLRRWIQTGYIKRAFWVLIFFVPVPVWLTDFYFEVQAVTWYELNILKFTHPVIGEYYTYSIYHVGGDTWQILIQRVDGYILLSIRRTVSSSDPTELYVGAETTANDVIITGSHFKNLKYYQNGNWYLWNYHYNYLGTFPDGLNNPYEISMGLPHYEFEAWGP